MEITLNTLKSNFKEMTTWKKVLLFVPFILLILLALILGAATYKDRTKRSETLLDKNKKVVDDVVAKAEKSEAFITDRLKELEKKREIIKQRVQQDEKDYNSLMQRIDSANSSSELQHLAQELRERTSVGRSRDDKDDITVDLGPPTRNTN